MPGREGVLTPARSREEHRGGQCSVVPDWRPGGLEGSANLGGQVSVSPYAREEQGALRLRAPGAVREAQPGLTQESG